MKVGVNLINFGPGATPEALLSWAQLVEELGYHLLMTSDHVTITPDVAGRYPAPFYEPLTLLGWLAGVTRRLELGTTVIIVPYRHPLETARATAVLSTRDSTVHATAMGRSSVQPSTDGNPIGGNPVGIGVTSATVVRGSWSSHATRVTRLKMMMALGSLGLSLRRATIKTAVARPMATARGCAMPKLPIQPASLWNTEPWMMGVAVRRGNWPTAIRIDAPVM